MTNPLKPLKQNHPTRKILSSIALAVGILILIYIVMQVRWLFSGPRITITSPADMVSNLNMVTIVGRSPRAINATVNGVAAPVDTGGYFVLDVLLYPGVNTITIKTENRYQKFSTKSLQILYTPKIVPVSDIPAVEESAPAKNTP